MKILYGVQGTGNGHITRARIMARALSEAGIEVDWVFSGRAREDFFDMEAFGDFKLYRGLTFAVSHGRVLYGRTLLTSNLLQLYRDVRSVDVEGYDLIINDFEPVSAWAARRAGKKVLGLSHQNAFMYDIPKRGDNIFIAQFMRYFAPVTRPIGLHWHHFNQPILPPLIEPSHYPNKLTPHHYLVYLPFGDLEDIAPQLRAFPESQFFVYQRVLEPRDEDNIHVRPFSREGFQQDLHRCEGVICSAGFELLSEAIQLGKKLLVCPVAGQMEQYSNALALSRLGYGSVAKNFSEQEIGVWLPQPCPEPITYPDVAGELVQWLQGDRSDLQALSRKLWQQIPEPSSTSEIGSRAAAQ